MKINEIVAAAAVTMSATAMLSGFPGVANADAYYEFTETGAFFGSAEFIYDAPALLSSDTTVNPQSCYVSGGASCGGVSFDLSPNAFGGTDDEISVSDNSGSTGFFFFQQGALSNYGAYTDAGYPIDTPGYGNAAFATLSVTSAAPTPLVPFPALPEPSSWFLMIAGVGGVGAMLRRGNKTAALGEGNTRPA
jgi:hypothetical protein